MTADRLPEEGTTTDYPGRAPVIPGIRFADLPTPVVERSRMRTVIWVVIVLVIVAAAAGAAWLAVTGQLTDLLDQLRF